MDKKKRQAAAKGKKEAAVPKVKAETKAPAAPKEPKEPKAPRITASGLPPLPKLPSINRPRKKKIQPCACGCGTDTSKTWAPGHDARAKGWALRIDRGICKMSDVPENEQQGAKAMLKLRRELAAAGGGDGQGNLKVVRGGKGKKATEPVAEQPAPATEPTPEPANPAINE